MMIILRYFCLPMHFDKWYTKGSPISLMPLGLVKGISTSGLKYNLQNESLETGVNSGSSNEAAEDGTVQINYQSGTLLLMECKD
jgi:thiamine pyrophosphokinase